MPNDLGFSIEMPDEERNYLLEVAANEISQLPQHLGDGGKEKKSASADMLKAIMDDAIILPPLPIIYKISDEAFLAKGFELPVDIKQIIATHNFYWLQVPVGVFPKENWAYNRIEVGIVMEPQPNEDIPRAFRILPDKEFQDLVQLDTGGQVGLDANFNFAGKTQDFHFDYKGNKLDISAGAQAEASFKSKLVFGPLSFKIRRVKLDYQGKNTQIVKWVLNDTNHIQDGFDLVVILQLPKSYTSLNVYAEVRARKSLHDFPSLLDLMKYMTEKARLILKTGCPTRDTKEWDLASYL